jgi:phage shock protein PspC (stress-responsive transcriptional regulator)
MKEVRQISLNGIVFFIEEDGYIALKKYIGNLEHYYADKEGGKEIIEDIQIRFAELLLEKRTYQGQAVTLSNIEDVISILGYPDNFEAEEPEQSKRKDAPSSQKYRRLYRDLEDSRLGGVCSGLSYYFGINVLVFRLIFLFLGICSVGFWTLVYIILWLVIPSAKTTQQRYEMKGEALNIEDIEQKIKDGVNEAGEKIKNFANNNADSIKNTGHELYSVGKNIFKFVAKLLGVCLICISVYAIVMLVLTWFFPLSSFFGIEKDYNHFFIHEIFPIFGLNDMTSYLCFLCILAPVIMLLFLGMIFLISKIRKAVSFMFLTTFILWIVLCIFLGVGAFAFIKSRETNNVCETTEISIPVSAQNIVIKPDHAIISGKTLKLRFNKWCLLIQHENSQNQVYGITDINRNIIYTDDTNVVIRVLKRNFKEGQIYEIQEDIKVEDSIIYIPSSFRLEDNYWSGEKINVQLLIPKWKQVTIDESFTRKRYRYYIDFD